MSFQVQNKVALVTGSNRGIGKAIVEGLIKAGASKVYAGVRQLDTAKPLVEAFGNKVVPIQIDLGKPETIKQAANTAKDVQLVINNAGVLKQASPLDPTAIESLNYELSINLHGLIHMAQAFAPVLKANGGGAFVQLNSVVSIKTFANVATYSASKAASYSITQALRDSLKEQGTVVVSVHPGPISTDMANEAGFGEIAEPASLVSDSIIHALANGEFHAFPDSMAKQIGGAYQSYAKSIVEANLSEG